MKGRFFDIGCGDGKTLHELKKSYPTTNFFGIALDSAELAKQNNPQAGIVTGSCDFILFGDGMFDVIFSSKIFDYSELGGTSPVFPKTFRTQDLAQEVKRVLRKSGIYIIFESIEKYQADLFKLAGLTPLIDDLYLRVFQK